MFLRFVIKIPIDKESSSVQEMFLYRPSDRPLTDYSLVTPYGNMELGQHWLRQWFVAWRLEAITWTRLVY